MKNISIVLGYGVYIEPNIDYLNKYLQPVLSDILIRNPDLIITCGGPSNPQFTPLTEAESIKNLFLKLYSELEPKVITENTSLSTPESLDFTAKIISSQHPDCQSIIIYVDSCRAPKAFYLCLSLFLNNKNLTEKEKIIVLGQLYSEKLYDFSSSIEMNYKNITVVGVPLSDTLALVARQSIASMLEMHAFDYPDLHQKFIDERKKQWRVK